MDGITTSKASSAFPPCAVGSVRGPTTPSISITEPGQPWVMITGSALSCCDLTWMKWTSTPSISVMNWGWALSSASTLRQSCSADQFLGREACVLDPIPKIAELILGDVDVEGSDLWVHRVVSSSRYGFRN